MIDATLVALGFVRGDDGVLYALRIVLGDGTAITAVLSKTALKFSRAGGKR